MWVLQSGTREMCAHIHSGFNMMANFCRQAAEHVKPLAARWT